MNQPLPLLPARIAKLPRDHRGFPIPWFVAVLDDGTRDFRIMDPVKRVRAVKHKLCWVCGEQLGRHMAFVIGPMCVVNRVTAEPPCHLDCAEFSAKGCPFLSRPRMRRNEKDMPEGHRGPGGIMIERNPGATCVYITQSYRTFKTGNGWLIQLGTPSECRWFAEGGTATRRQVEASISSGYPLLRAEAEKEGPEALQALFKMLVQAGPLLPA